MLRSAVFAVALCMAPAAFAGAMPPSMSKYIYVELLAWVNHPQIVAAIKDQNARTGRLGKDEIMAQDKAWRAEVGSTQTPLIDSVLKSSLSEFLKEHRAASKGRILEIFVMDSSGLNVAASDITSDYWQGDEDKYTKTYPVGAGAVFVDVIQLDESTQSRQGQVSFTVTDPSNGKALGAITIGLNADAFP